MANFVLVPGFWLGGWAWRGVEKILRGKGHEVYSLTLTGLGERVHLANAEVNLETHVADVINTIKYNELDEVYLVGHSYAAMVITQVADQIPEKITKLIYVDSAPLPDGSKLIDFYSPEQLEKFEKIIARNDSDWSLPLPEWDEMDEGDNLKDLSQTDKKLIEKLATAQPFNTARQQTVLKNPERQALPKLAITSTFPIAQIKELIDGGAPLFQEMADPKFEFIELPTGHYPMFSRTAELAELLDNAIRDT